MKHLLQILGLATLVYVTHAISYSDFLSDLSYLYDSQPRKNPMSDYYSDNLPYEEDGNWGVLYPDTIKDPSPKETRDYGEAVLRDQEYMKQLPLSGYQYISGGSGRDEEPTEVKTDKVLPAYCNPPNPCPVGYTEDDNCITNFENTPENNQQLQEQETCSCDTEHMLSCPEGQKTIDPKSADFGDAGAPDDMANLQQLVNMNLGANNKGFENMLNLEELSLGKQPKQVASKKAAPRNYEDNM